MAVRHFWVAAALCTVAELFPSKVKRSWDAECLFIATMYSCLGRAEKCSYFIFQARLGRLPFHPDMFPESLLDGFEASGTSATANTAYCYRRP